LDHRVAASYVLITWPGFDREGDETGGRLVAAGHRLRFAPKSAERSSADMIELLAGVAAAIVSTDPFDAAVFRSTPDLRVIARVGVGVDSIDLEAAARAGVAVCTTPGANASTTADHAVALMLATLRRIPEYDVAVRGGRWARTGAASPWELNGSTVGLIGYGAIGRLVRRRLSGFDTRVLVHDPGLVSERGVESVGLEELLSRSHVVSLHAPLTPATVRLIDGPRLALMRSEAVLVNTARGGLVDERALVDALEHGRLRAAGLDVFELEPPTRSRLLSLPNVVLTPHVGGVSDRSVREMTRRATDAVLDVLSGRAPRDAVEVSA
jgi:phosphoglycerate dehydrogenase-like enzyme